MLNITISQILIIMCCCFLLFCDSIISPISAQAISNLIFANCGQTVKNVNDQNKVISLDFSAPPQTSICKITIDNVSVASVGIRDTAREAENVAVPLDLFITNSRFIKSSGDGIQIFFNNNNTVVNPVDGSIAVITSDVPTSITIENVTFSTCRQAIRIVEFNVGSVLDSEGNVKPRWNPRRFFFNLRNVFIDVQFRGIDLEFLNKVGSVLVENVTSFSQRDGFLLTYVADVKGNFVVRNSKFYMSLQKSSSDGARPLFVDTISSFHGDIIIEKSDIRVVQAQQQFFREVVGFSNIDLFNGSLIFTRNIARFEYDEIDNLLRFALYLTNVHFARDIVDRNAIDIQDCDFFVHSAQGNAVTFFNVSSSSNNNILLPPPSIRIRNNTIVVNTTKDSSYISNGILFGQATRVPGEVVPSKLDSVSDFNNIVIEGNRINCSLVTRQQPPTSINNPFRDLETATTRNMAIYLVAVNNINNFVVHNNDIFQEILPESVNWLKSFKTVQVLSCDLSFKPSKFQNLTFSSNRVIMSGIANIVAAINWMPSGVADVEKDYFLSYNITGNRLDFTKLTLVKETVSTYNAMLVNIMAPSMMVPTAVCFMFGASAKWIQIKNSTCELREAGVLTGELTIDGTFRHGGVYVNSFLQLACTLARSSFSSIEVTGNTLTIIPLFPTASQLLHALQQKQQSSPNFKNLKNYEIGGLVQFFGFGPISDRETNNNSNGVSSFTPRLHVFRVADNSISINSTGAASFATVSFIMLGFYSNMVSIGSTSSSTSASIEIKRNSLIVKIIQSTIVAGIMKERPPRFGTVGYEAESLIPVVTLTKQYFGMLTPAKGVSISIVTSVGILGDDKTTNNNDNLLSSLVVDSNVQTVRQIFETNDNANEQQQIRNTLSSMNYQLSCFLFNASTNLTTANAKYLPGGGMKHVLLNNNTLDAADSPCTVVSFESITISGDLNKLKYFHVSSDIVAKENVLKLPASSSTSLSSSLVNIEVLSSPSSVVVPPGKFSASLNLFGNQIVSTTATNRSSLDNFQVVATSSRTAFFHLIDSINISASPECNRKIPERRCGSGVIGLSNFFGDRNLQLQIVAVASKSDLSILASQNRFSSVGCSYRTPSLSLDQSMSQTEQVPPPMPLPAAYVSSLKVTSAAGSAATALLAVGAISSPALSFTVARQQAMLNYARAAVDGDCRGLFPAVSESGNKDDAPELSGAESPTQLSIGNSRARYYVGSVVGNVLYTVLLVAFGQLIGHASRKYLSKDEKWDQPLHVFARSHLGVIFFFISAVLVTPTFSNALLVSVAMSNAEVSVGVKVILVLLALVFVFAATLFVAWCAVIRLPRREQYRITFDIEKMMKAGKSHVLAVFFWLLRAEGSWKLPSNRKTEKEERDFLIAEGCFESYRSTKWFVLVELVTGLLLALPSFFAQFAADGKSSCIIQGSLLIVIMTVYFVILVWKRPQKLRFMRFFVPVLTFQQWLTILLTLVNVVLMPPNQQQKESAKHESRIPEWLFQILAIPASMELVLSVVSIIAALWPIVSVLMKYAKRVFSDGKKSVGNDDNNAAEMQDHGRVTKGDRRHSYDHRHYSDDHHRDDYRHRRQSSSSFHRHHDDRRRASFPVASSFSRNADHDSQHRRRLSADHEDRADEMFKRRNQPMTGSDADDVKRNRRSSTELS